MNELPLVRGQECHESVAMMFKKVRTKHDLKVDAPINCTSLSHGLFECLEYHICSMGYLVTLLPTSQVGVTTLINMAHQSPCHGILNIHTL